MRAPWLPDVLADAGLNPRVLAGARGRGRDMATVYGVVVHDTVTPSRSWSNARVDALLRDGHANLAGPLSQLGCDFDGRPVVIADGRCNHNGHGTWGNDAIGIEVYAGGGMGPEPWTPAQRDKVEAMCRAILGHLNLGRSSHWNPRVAGHKETDPGRKQDPYGVDVGVLRRALAGPAPTEEDDMPAPKDWDDRDVARMQAIMARTMIVGTDKHLSWHLRRIEALAALTAGRVADLGSMSDEDMDALIDGLADAVGEADADRFVDRLVARMSR